MTPLARFHARVLPEEPQVPVPQETAHGEYGQRGQYSMCTIALHADLAALTLPVTASRTMHTAVRAGEPSRNSGVRVVVKGIDGLGAESGRSRASVAPSTQKVITETVDVTDPHGSVQQKSGDLPGGGTKMTTADVDGVVRTAYEITTAGGKEVFRIPAAQVVATRKVGEVVLVGTGAAKKQGSKPDQSQGRSQSQDQSQSQRRTPMSSASSESFGDSGDSASGDGAGTTGGGAEDDGVWIQFTQCESGGNPATDTGNGFYGMYQFTLETWQSLGGAGYPHKVGAVTQTATAEKP